MAIHVVTDSTCDLTPEIMEGLDITVVPLSIYFGDEELLDGVDIDAPTFYKRLVEAKDLPRTSQPSVEAFTEVYRRLTENGDEVFSVHISTKLSGTLNSAHNARLALEDASDRIHLFDSENVSIGLGVVALEAARAAKDGASMDGVKAAAESARKRVRVIALVGTLEYLQRGGRIGRAQSMLGSMLRIKPIVQVDDGEVAPFDRVRTYKRAVERLLEFVKEHKNAETVFVGSGGNADEATEFAKRIQEAFPDATIKQVYLGPVIGVYTGPVALGVGIVDPA
jgi:DegV family protein with EDD domain